MSEPTRRRRRSVLPDVDDLFEAMLPYRWRMQFEQNPVRIEEYLEDGDEIIRAELPGVDPDKDIDLTVHEGVLTIRCERAEEKTEKNRSEFRYGSFLRRVMLPVGADESKVTASYDKGILTVRIPVREPETSERRIQVEH